MFFFPPTLAFSPKINSIDPELAYKNRRFQVGKIIIAWIALFMVLGVIVWCLYRGGFSTNDYLRLLDPKSWRPGWYVKELIERRQRGRIDSRFVLLALQKLVDDGFVDMRFIWDEVAPKDASSDLLLSKSKFRLTPKGVAKLDDMRKRDKE